MTDKCVCGSESYPAILVGAESTPICEQCFKTINDNDLEWNENITRKELENLIKTAKTGRKNKNI